MILCLMKCWLILTSWGCRSFFSLYVAMNLIVYELNWIELLNCHWLNNWIIILLNNWMIEWLIEWLNDWVIEWMNDWLNWIELFMIEWLDDWMIGWLNESTITWSMDLSNRAKTTPYLTNSLSKTGLRTRQTQSPWRMYSINVLIASELPY